MITFSHIIFYVANVPATLAFYEKAFDLKIKFIHESNNYAEMVTGNVTLAFVNAEGLAATNLPDGFIRNSLTKQPQACEIVFSTDDPDALYAKAVAAGATPVTPPKMKPWGQVVGYVRDADGILIEVAQVM
jgi:lactoylglutathione lyase